jgi:hypothetical protein
MVSPVALPVPIGTLHPDWPRPIHHRRGHDHRCRVHDHWRRRDDYRCGINRYPNTDGYSNPCVCRERQGKSCETENGDNGKHSEKRFRALHSVCPLVVADYARPFLL